MLLFAPPEKENFDQYQRARAELERLVQVARTASTTWQTNPPLEPRKEIGARLFIQASERAWSILHLAIDLPKSDQEYPLMIDVLTPQALVRALLETYLHLYYFAVDDINDHELELRYNAWALCGEKIRVTGFKHTMPDHPELERLEAGLENWKNEFRNHPLYKDIKNHQQERVEKGRDPLIMEKADIAEKAGISKTRYYSLNKYVSDYTHGGPLAEAQHREFLQDPRSAIGRIKAALNDATGLMSFAITDFQSVIPRAKWRIEPHDGQLMLAYRKVFETTPSDLA